MAVSNTALIQRVRNFTDERPYVTTATATTDVTTTIAVTDGEAWDEGAILEFQDNGEQCFVQSVSGNNLTVVRGWNGTTRVAHASITAFRDPVYTYNTILQAIDSAIDRLFPHVFKISTTTVTPAPTTTVWYSLPSGLLGLVQVDQVYGSTDQHVGRFGHKNSGRGVIFARNMPATISASGFALKFPHGFFDNTNDVSVTYKTHITGTSDIEDDGRLPVADALVYGALETLLIGTEAKRVVEGEDVEPSRTVRAGARTTLGQNYGLMFRLAVQQLKLKLDILYPELREVQH